MDFTIVKTTEEMIPQVHALTIPERWNYGILKVKTLCSADPNGSFCAVNSNGEVIGHCSAAKMTDDLAIGGCVVVREDCRGKGVLRALLKASNSYTEEANVGADVNVYSDHTYHKMHKFTAFQMITFWGKLETTSVKNLRVDKKYNIVPLKEINFGDLSEYDTHIHSGIPRPRILETYLKDDDARTLVATCGNKIVGYGTLVPADVDFALGPLYGDDVSIMETLLKSILEMFLPSGRNVWLIVQSEHEIIPILQQTLKLQEVERQKRMYTKEIVMPNLRKIGALLNDDLLC